MDNTQKLHHVDKIQLKLEVERQAGVKVLAVGQNKAGLCVYVNKKLLIMPLLIYKGYPIKYFESKQE